ncbi:MAG TPA: 16S rRNA (uracil(1498)-N(3))-methyltransferase [Rickettsiales bacterium]|nr:16S rRNA (uracil(1498)-N(3))-methyltransferase [Rickettsiales bacterium]
MRKIRLFIERNGLNLGFLTEITGQDFEYLTKVMRIKVGDEISVFNGFDGDFTAKITEISKKSLAISLKNQIRKQDLSTNITLAFAPVKNVRIDFIAQKAVELGVASFQPMITARSIVDKINFDRFKANIKEACEQCETNFIPQILPIKKLEKLLEDITLKDKILLLCDESGNGKKAQEILPKIAKNRSLNQEIMIFIGPEGGFSVEEFKKFRQIKNLHSLSLGKRILRSDTAIISALSLVQEFVD